MRPRLLPSALVTCKTHADSEFTLRFAVEIRNRLAQILARYSYFGGTPHGYHDK
jgi:hypothetical protein